MELRLKAIRKDPIVSVNPSWYLILSSILFSIGVLGVLFRRNAIIVLMSIELMLNAVMLVFVSFSMFRSQIDAQVVVFFIMIVAAAEVAVGLVIVSSLYKKTGQIDVEHWSQLKE